MRKFFMMVAVVALALLVATPSMALDFKFGAEYRVRFYTMVNRAFVDEPGSNPSGIQLRIRPRFDVSDDNGNMTATLRLEIGDIEWGQGGGAMGATNAGANGNVPGSTSRVGNGSGGRVGTDGVNVETKWGYIDFASPFGVPLRWRAGLQGWYLTKGMVVDDDVAGLRAYGKYGMLSYEAGMYVGASNSTTVDDNLNYYQVKVDAAIMKQLNVGGYYIYGRNAATGAATLNTVATQQFMGFGANGDFGFLRYDLDFVFGQQNGGNSGDFGDAGRRNVRGWGLDGGVHVPVGPVLIHVVGSYATGDDNDGGASEVLPWIAPSWNGAGGLYQLIGSGGDFDATETTQDYPGGLWMIGVGAEYRPVKALWFRAMYGYAGFTGNGPCSAAANLASTCYGPTYPAVLVGEDTLGHEISLRADYTVWTNFRIMGGAAWLIPSEGDTVQEYVLQFLYNF